jgi:Septum formation
MTDPKTVPVASRSLLSRAGLARVAGLCAVLLLASGCWTSSVFGSKTTVPTTSVSVFKVEIGQCFNPPPGAPKLELSDLTAIPCTAPHNQEAYAALVYKAPAGGDDSIYPGNDALAAFANGSCAQAFQGYVGVSYLDSSLFFTYLLPSARSWEQGDDRTVLCFVTTTGKPLVVSVKGSKM